MSLGFVTGPLPPRRLRGACHRGFCLTKNAYPSTRWGDVSATQHGIGCPLLRAWLVPSCKHPTAQTSNLASGRRAHERLEEPRRSDCTGRCDPSRCRRCHLRRCGGNLRGLAAVGTCAHANRKRERPTNAGAGRDECLADHFSARGHSCSLHLADRLRLHLVGQEPREDRAGFTVGGDAGAGNNRAR